MVELRQNVGPALELRLKEVEEEEKLLHSLRRLAEVLSTVPRGVEEDLRDARKQIARLEERTHAELRQISQDALQALIRLEAEVERLELDLVRLRHEYQRQIGVRPKSGAAAETKPAEAKKEGKKPRGAPVGHPGATREIPDHWDQEEVIPPPPICPKCGKAHLVPVDKFDTKFREDIPPIVKVVTLERYQQAWCPDCESLVHHPRTEGPPVVIGPNLAAHLARLSQLGLTTRKLSYLSSDILGIELSPSGVEGILRRMSFRLEPDWKDIGLALKKADWLNVDETSWRMYHERGYFWIFINTRLAYFWPDLRRSGDVPREILGLKYKGTLICDFLSVYNCFKKTQRCWIHLLRDIKEERELRPDHAGLKELDERVRALIQAGLEYRSLPEGEEKKEARAELEKELRKIGLMTLPTGKPMNLVLRVKKYRKHLLRFVDNPEIDYQNNRAERGLRPLVIQRKLSFGSDSKVGVHRTAILMSIIETCRLQGIDPTEYLRQTWLGNRANLPDLTGPPE